MNETEPFADTITSTDALREIYRQPHPVTAGKERPQLDQASTEFIERCRFAVVGTYDSEGNADTSPRGGPSGFVRVLDPGRLAIADLGGNNRLDTLQNIVDTGRIALIFVVPGQSETVRVNGRAWVTTDPYVLGRFELPRMPKSAIGVAVDTTYIHCAKAFQRGGMWEPEAWAELADVPDGAAILACQVIVEGATAEAIRADLDQGYVAALAEERSPE